MKNSPFVYGTIVSNSSSEARLTSVSVMERYKPGTPRNVSKNRDMLINNYIIQTRAGGFEFMDPAYELWFRLYFLDQPLSKLFK